MGGLRDPDVETRRAAALQARSADVPQLQTALPILMELLRSEEDGQVRLSIFDAVTAMGPAAEPAVDALLYTLRTDYGGKRNEELHQDYRAALALAAIGEPAVAGLCELLTAEAVNVRAEAAMAIGRIETRSAHAIEKLNERLTDESERVRREAAFALGKIGAPATDTLVASAKASDAMRRVAALRALRLVGSRDEAVGGVVLAATRDPDPQVRAAAIAALDVVVVAEEAKRQVLLKNLQDPQESVRVAVVNAFLNDRERLREAVPELSELLTASQESVHWHAAFLLQRSGEEGAERLMTALENEAASIRPIARALSLYGAAIRDRLITELQHPEPRVRQGAALALGQIRPLAEDHIRHLARGLEDSDPGTELAFLAAVGHLGERGRSAVPAVRRKLSHPAAAVRQQAIEFLLQAAPHDGQLITDLQQLLNDDELAVQRKAIDALRALGPVGRSALPLVIGKLHSDDAEVRSAAAAMVGSHGRAAAAAVPVLASMLEDPLPETREQAAATLGQLGPSSRSALDELLAALHDKQPQVRAAVIATLGNLDLTPEELRPHFSAALGDEDSDVRREVLRGIRRLGRRGTLFIPDLILLTENGRLRRFVGRALERYERYGPDERSIPELASLLTHERDEVRLWAIKFLSLAGPAAAPAVADLERLVSDPNAEISEQAKSALAAISGQTSASEHP